MRPSFTSISQPLASFFILYRIPTLIAKLGDIIEVQLPTAAVNPGQEAGGQSTGIDRNPIPMHSHTEAGHRGFAFVTYGSSGDAQDAIDNMDLNELKGRVIKVNLARPSKGATQPFGRASESS